ncbi:hypothetical protein BDZ97DRAFT_1905448 [Flammula alnicola]|nr:hypothetical protein BDZ97DRAFT_1905448 [Flammula alnicola]
MAAARILHDPNISVQPDFTITVYDFARNAVAQAEGITPAEATERMTAAWNADQNDKIAAWNLQLEADQVATQAAMAQAAGGQQIQPPQQQQEPPPPPPPLLEPHHHIAEQANPQRPLAKKKAKLRPFQANKPVATESTPRPSRFAIHKLEEHEYVELHYFTPEACVEAEKYDQTISQDSFMITKVDETMAFKPMAAHKASSKIVSDENLSWKQMTLAKNTMLAKMAKTGWPESYVFALATFYLHLENHRLRTKENGEAALLKYQAQVRREWHDALRNTTSDEPVFDISIINEQ